MSLQIINIGTAANDHGGDSLRTAGSKMNQVLVYSYGTHNWGNVDWKAAMMDWVNNNAPSYWAQNGHGDLSYTPPGGGSPALIVGANGTVAFNDASTLTPDGSGHLLYSGELGLGISSWDRYPYEATALLHSGDTKFGIYSEYTSLDAGAGASLTFGFPYAVNSDSLAPGFELQMISDPSNASTYMRFNYIERTSSGVVTAALGDIFDVFGDGHATAMGPLTVTNDIESQTSGGGLIIQDSSAVRWRILVDTSGNLSTTPA